MRKDLTACNLVKRMLKLVCHKTKTVPCGFLFENANSQKLKAKVNYALFIY